MKFHLAILGPVLLCVASFVYAQKPAGAPPKTVEDLVLKKQVFVDDVESGSNAVQYPAVRVNIRYKLAEWLWKNGRDDTGRAEPLAVKAVEELYGKRSDIPSENLSALSKNLFALLDKNAPNAGARLKKKYNVGAGSDIYAAYEKIDKPGGDTEAARAIIRSLAAGDEFDEMVPALLGKMAAMRSPRIPAVLGALLEAMEADRISYDLKSLGWIFPFFINEAVPAPLKNRYFVLVLGKARAQMQQQTSATGYDYRLLENVIFALGKTSPDLVAEAEAVRLVLINRGTGVTSARLEADRRIAEADDKVGALMDEAERAIDEGQKLDFYIRAVNLAISESKFKIAIDVIDRLRSTGQRDFIEPWTDLQLGFIARKAFEKDELDPAVKATENIRDGVKGAEAWKVAALYFDGKKDGLNARDALDKAIGLLSDESTENPFRTFTLVRAIPDVRKIDRSRLTEVIVLAAKAINDLPTPGIDDKPGTVNYQRYIACVFQINRDLDSAMPKLLKGNRLEAEDLTGRLQKKEVRVFADMLIGIDKLETAKGAK
jgi:hypothetical protein